MGRVKVLFFSCFFFFFYLFDTFVWPAGHPVFMREFVCEILNKLS